MKNFIIILFFTGLSLAALSQNVAQVEYFIDADAGYGNNAIIDVTPSADGTFPFTLNLSSFIPGYHKLYIRTKDSDGKWSLTARRNIEVLASAAKTTIIRGEYFVDTDPGVGTATPITIATPDSIILQNFTAVASGLSEGYHKLYGRFKDNQGKWGLTFRRNIEVYKSDTTKVIKAEYFFRTDQGFGNCASVTIASPVADGSFSFNIPRNTIPEGADTLFVRVQNDAENRWSLTQWENGISGALPLTLLKFNVTKQNTTAWLNWQTANELNTAYFNVQRSTDAVNFTNVGKVAAKPANGAQNGYSYADDIASLKAGKVYYRLQMTDNDGKFTYSRIAYITINADGIHITLYPNPAHSYFVIADYESLDVSKASVVVRDITGRMLINQKFNNTTEQKINIASLSKGLYMVSIVTPGNVHTQKLLVE
jgi:Secretion system C-terminal sorting domain